MTSKEKDYKAVLEAVERGEVWAKTELAWYKLSGLGGCEIDENGAVALLEEGIKERYAEAMWMLGLCNEFGRGCEQDIERGEELYKQSSEVGNEIGKILYRMHERGSGYFEANCSTSKKIEMINKLIAIAPWMTVDLRGNNNQRKERKQLTTKEEALYLLEWTDNEIGPEGAIMISEILKINTTLTKLDLRGDWNTTIEKNEL